MGDNLLKEDNGSIYESRDITDSEFDLFVKNHEHGDICQLSTWAKVKSPQWYNRKVAIYKGDILVGVASLLFRKIPKTSWTLCYSPRGFVMDYSDAEIVGAMINAVKEVAKEENSFEIKIDPSVSIYSNSNTVDILGRYGFIHSGFKMGIEGAQPRYTMYTDISDDLETVKSSFSSMAKRRINNALKNPITCREYDRSYLPVFADLMMITGERDNFDTRDISYFNKIFDKLGPNGDARLFLTSTTYNDILSKKESEKNALNKEINNLNKKLYRINQETDDKKFHLQKDIYGKIQKLEKVNEDIVLIKDKIDSGEDPEKSIYLSGAILAFCGPIAYYLYGASSNEYRDLYPNYLMQWTMMKASKAKGCRFYDFGAVSGYTEQEDLKYDHMAGLYEFKRLFGTKMYERVGEFNLVLKPGIEKIFKFAMKVRLALIKFKKR